MSTRIQIKRGTTDPAGLTVGEFAYNVTNSTLYIGNTASQKWIGGEVTGGTDMGAGSAASQNRVPTQNAVYQYARNNFVYSVNGLTGPIQFTGGANITITQSGNTLTIAASDTVGVTAGDAVTWTKLQTFNSGISAAGGITFNGPFTGATATFTRLVTASAGISAAGGITLASPNLTGTPLATTATVGTNTTQIATTAFVQNEIVADTVTSFNGRTGSVQGVSAATAGDGISVSGSTGAVTITNSGVTRAVAGTGISVSANTGTVTITNNGVQSFNGLTGAVGGVCAAQANTFSALQTFTGGISAAGVGITLASPNLTGTPLATTAAVGTNTTQIATTAFVQNEIVADTVTSFNGRTGSVQGVSAAVAGDGISVSGATGSVTITNTGVTRAAAGTGISVSANTGTVTITNTGALLTANTFTGLQTFTAGISAAGGITLTSPYFTGAPESLSLRTGKLIHPSGQAYITIQPSTVPGSGSLRFQNDTIDPATYYATLTATSTTADSTIVLPAESGTLALTKNVVTSFNGRTGAIQGVSSAAAGDGISVSGATGAVTITNSGVTRAVAGTGISVSANTGTVTITNNGVQSFNGSTGAISGVGSIVAGTNISITPTGGTGAVTINAAGVTTTATNTFTAVQIFTSGLSAGGGVTLASPNLTGTPLATTAAVGTNTTQIATTAFVQNEIVADTVTSFNGRTGAVQGVSAAVAGDGISVSGATGSVTITNSGVTRAVAGTGIGLNANTGTVTITNNGVQSFNGLTGAVGGVCAAQANTFSALQTFTGGISAAGVGITLASPNLTGTPLATTAAVGTNTTQIATTAFVQNEIIADTVTSFNGRTGAVQGVSAAVAGDGISVSGSTGAVTFTNSGVTRAVAGTGIGLNANTGTVTITNNGVQSFNGSTGAIQGVSSIVAGTNVTISPTGGTGAVTINSVGVTSTAAYTWSAAQTFNGGVTASTLDVTGNTRLNGNINLGNDTADVTTVAGGATFNRTLDVTDAARFNGTATFNNTLTGLTATFNRLITAAQGITVSGTNYVATSYLYGRYLGQRVAGQTLELLPGPAIASGSYSGLGFQYVDLLDQTFVGTVVPTALAADRTYTLPDDSGTFAFTKGTVWRLNGITGGITLNQGTNITITSSVAGGITISSTASGGGGALTADANIWTATQYFNAGFSAASGVTFTGTVAANGGLTASTLDVSGNARVTGSVVATQGFTFGGVGTTFLAFYPLPSASSGGLWLRDGIFQVGGSVFGVGQGVFNFNPNSEAHAMYGNLTITTDQGYQAAQNTLTMKVGSTHTGKPLRVQKAAVDVAYVDATGGIWSDGGFMIGSGAISAKTSGYTLTANDNGKVLTFNSTSAIVIGVDTAAGATGFSCTLIQLGTGGVRLASSGVTLNSYAGLTFAGQHAAASLVCYQTNVFNVSGNLTP